MVVGCVATVSKSVFYQSIYEFQAVGVGQFGIGRGIDSLTEVYFTFQNLEDQDEVSPEASEKKLSQ